MPYIPPGEKTARNIIVVTTAMLSFISFWRAAAIVLCDIASTVYYIGGIAEHAIGKAAPWFILGVMLFSYAVRSIYIESCGMFVRGGVYRVVKEAMGGTLAKLSVSALMFDYVLTGPISAVSAGQYLVGLLNASLSHFGILFHLSPGFFSVLFAVAVTLYFWWQNVKGIPESSDKALKIMMATTVMGVLMIGWSVLTLWIKGFAWPPAAPVFSQESLGWLYRFKNNISPLGLIGITIAFGHSLLAMSGEESLAQIYREIEAPKLKNLKRAAFIVFLFSMLLTTLGTFFAALIIPDDVRMSQYSDNLMSGLAMHLVGPIQLKLLFQGFVVFVGFLILSGAVNTSIIGANGVLNRIGEDRILPEFLRHPHPRFGTSSRLINLTVGLQLITILLCRGNVYVLGEAYAFGVIWSFVFKALAVLMLRYQDKTPREWKVPLNLNIFGRKFPFGLAAIFAVLFLTAAVNLVTKKVATISGSIFALSFFVIFIISEKINERKHKEEGVLARAGHIDKVNFNQVDFLTKDVCDLAKPRRVLVPVRDPKNLIHLRKVLEEIDPDETEVVVLSSKVAKGLHLEGDVSQPMPEDEELLTRIIEIVEKIGRPVTPILLPTNDPYYAIARAAYDLGVEEIILGKSGKFSPEVQMEEIAVAWGAVTPPNEADRHLKIRIVWDGKELTEKL